MSPDDILAANLWPWPDPLLKRDQAGNVLFVNAAFLQLYGGRVEDWNGRGISGWPAPNPTGAQRFETRAGQAPNESTYDWVEMIMADGNSMAIARNVTALIAKPTPPADVQPAFEAPAVAAAIAPPSFAPPPVAQPATPEPALRAPAPVSAPAPEPQQPAAFEDALNNNANDYAYKAEEPASIAAPEPAEPTPADTPRMIERRALPIEDSSALLGSSWRDEVIAKALGSETDKQNAATTETPTPVKPAATPVKTEKKSTDKLHILLAEDNAINALLTRTLLEAEGAIVETVEDGALAVEAVKNNTYDMIFMDMRMPNMDGLESTRKIRGLGKTMPIVALTANAFDDDRNSCFDSGMNDFMTKPVSAEELVEMVATWTGEKEEKLAS